MWSIVLSIAFAIGLYLFIDNRIKASREAALKTVNAEAELKEKRGPSMLDAAAAVAVPFIANVGAGRFADAYQLLAAPYRSAVTPSAFEKVCRESPLLAGARSVALNRLRQQNARRRRHRRGHGCARLRAPARCRSASSSCRRAGGCGSSWCRWRGYRSFRV